MSARHTVSIPVRPYINKFALANCGDVDRVQYTRCGIHIWHLLNEQIRWPVAGLVNTFLPTGGRPVPELQVILVTHKPVQVPREVCTRVSDRLDELFRKDLCSFIDFQVHGFARAERKTAIITYMDLHDIALGDDIQYQSARRMYWLHERDRAGLPRPQYMRVHGGDRVRGW